MTLGRAARRLGPLVLEYHAVSDKWEADLAVTTLQLRRQLEEVVRRGYTGATFSEAVLGAASDKTVVVTFDDGYLSVLELAYPILSSLGLPGTVFVVTDSAETGRLPNWEGPTARQGDVLEEELRAMTWQQLREIAHSGWEIGSHTRTHPRLTEVPPDQLHDELRGSREACERELGRACLSLAYPFGDFNSRVAANAADAGYEAAAIEDLGPLDPLMWPRVGIYHLDSMLRFRLKVSPTVRWFRTGLAQMRGARR